MIVPNVRANVVNRTDEMFAKKKWIRRDENTHSAHNHDKYLEQELVIIDHSEHEFNYIACVIITYHTQIPECNECNQCFAFHIIHFNECPIWILYTNIRSRCSQPVK